MGDVAALMPIRHRAVETFNLDEYVRLLQTYGGGLTFTMTGDREQIGGDFAGLVSGAYKANGVVFACLLTRKMLFSEARFQWQQMRGGRPGDLFGTADLALIEAPEPGMTTGDLLESAILDADLAGDWFGAYRNVNGPRIKRLRPDWTIVIIGSPNDRYDVPADDPDAEVAGYVYIPGGPYSGKTPTTFGRDEVAHFFPIKDPLAKYRGLSIVASVMRELQADSAATTHKLMFFQNAATPNMVVKFPPALPKDKAKDWIDIFEQEHAGVYNAYRTVYLGAGADAEVVGANLQQMEFAATQGKGETRIAAALQVHPVVVGLSEGLQGSSLNAGNFQSAMRWTANKFARPNWRNMAGSLQTILRPLPGTRLWYDDRDIPFLAEDIKDAAEVLSLNAQAMRTLGDGGWEHDSVVDAVTSGDLRRLQHTGLVPVQLQPPGVVTALASFWPSRGVPSDVPIERGAEMSNDDPVVRAYPSLFGPAVERRTA